jgi:hypothetical protein
LTRSVQYQRWAVAFGVALLLCSPYLLYTYMLTNQPFYWGSSGGLSLYWMTSPYKGELGDWFPFTAMRDNPQVALHHAAFFNSIQGLDELRLDDAFKIAAINNIVHHPGKFLLNWFDNVGRLLIDYPYSFTPFKLRTIVFALANAPVIVLLTGSALALWRRRCRVPKGLNGVALVAGIAFIGSSLLSAEVRQFVPLVPWLGVLATATVWPAVRTMLGGSRLAGRIGPSLAGAIRVDWEAAE